MSTDQSKATGAEVARGTADTAPKAAPTAGGVPAPGVSHTTGPLSVQKKIGTYGTVVQFLVVDKRGRQVGSFDFHSGGSESWPSPAEAKANAHLYAAAPALLDLVERYASECAACGGAGHFQDVTITAAHGIKNPGEQCPECADIRAAIAQVKP